MRFARNFVASILALAPLGPVAAHHSVATFDLNRTLSLRGAVKFFQWSNPHCWIEILVPTDNGTKEWSIEMGSTTEMYRRGWRPHTLRAGETVTIHVYPARDGSPGVLFDSAEGPDGAPLGKPKPAHAP